MNVLVTGASGFIGTNLVRRLLDDKRDVKAMIRKTSDTKYLDKWGVKTCYGDVLDENSLKEAVKGVDVIYHLVTIRDEPNVPYAEYHGVNVEGLERLIRVSMNAGVKKIVNFSSIAAIGFGKMPLPLNEKSPLLPTNNYGRSKGEGEAVAKKYFEENGFNTMSVRPALVYGPYDLSNMKGLFLAIKDGTYRVIGSGKNKMCFVYVDDIVSGAILAEKKGKGGEKYILSDNRSYSQTEAAQTVADAMGVKLPKMRIPVAVAYSAGIGFEIVSKIFGFEPPLSRSRLSNILMNLEYDISKAKNELGYNPKVDLKEGIGRTVKWYRGQG
ncbi:MAG: NAD-dependent epimerase/dehydratase family protein, partial [archaeon]